MANYRNIVNIINFLRGYENDGTDLVESIRQNIRLLNKYQLKSSFLIQYDVFNSEEMMSLIKGSGPLFELGCWIEIVEPLIIDAGLPWRGTAPWDFHANVAFLMGYTTEEREKIIDTYMARFKKEFGYYPKTVGAWMIDSYSLKYLSDKYNVKAACICKEQYGTDGYNLWGGYYNHAYYPSKYNMICPAQTPQNQINLPVFRMLGTDPIHQYDSGLISDDGKIKPAKMQNVITIEPVYPQYGGNPEWVDWFLEQNNKGNQLCYSYVQIGQENSFDWKRSGDGLNYQYPKIKELLDKGEVEVEYLSESGEWFKQQFESTPPCAQPFDVDWSNKNAKSYWYYSKNYRLNIYYDSYGLRIRDLHMYNENYKERYYDDVETKIYSTYDNLPIVDGYRFSKEDFLAGGFFMDCNDKLINPTTSAYNSSLNGTAEHLIINCEKQAIEISCHEDAVRIESNNNFSIHLKGVAQSIEFKLVDSKKIKFTYQNFEYALELLNGNFLLKEDELYVISDDNIIEMKF